MGRSSGTEVDVGTFDFGCRELFFGQSAVTLDADLKASEIAKSYDVAVVKGSLHRKNATFEYCHHIPLGHRATVRDGFTDAVEVYYSRRLCFCIKFEHSVANDVMILLFDIKFDRHNFCFKLLILSTIN